MAMFAGLFRGAIALGRLLDYDEIRLVAIVVGIAALFGIVRRRVIHRAA